MANELTLGFNLLFEKADKFIPFGRDNEQFTVSGDQYVKQSQIIGTASAEAIYLGDVGKGGYFAGCNDGTTGTIEIRVGATGDDLIRLEPGDMALFRITDDATPYAIAGQASATLEYVVVDP